MESYHLSTEKQLEDPLEHVSRKADLAAASLRTRLLGEQGMLSRACIALSTRARCYRVSQRTCICLYT